MDSGSGPAGPGDERDRTVARALASLVPLTGPTAAERARIRARIEAGLDAAADQPPDRPTSDSAPPVTVRPT